MAEHDIPPVRERVAALLRIRLSLRSNTGLTRPSSLMIDKLTALPRSKIGEQIGEVSDIDMLALSRALVVFLGLA